MYIQEQFKETLKRTPTALLKDVLAANYHQRQKDHGNSEFLLRQSNIIRAEMLTRV